MRTIAEILVLLVLLNWVRIGLLVVVRKVKDGAVFDALGSALICILSAAFTGCCDAWLFHGASAWVLAWAPAAFLACALVYNGAVLVGWKPPAH